MSFPVLILLLIAPVASASAQAENPKGVYMESVDGWTLWDSGVRNGDVVLSWKLMTPPDIGFEKDSGEILSYSDWLFLLEELSPRGTVRLGIHRSGRPITLEVPPGLWSATARPVLREREKNRLRELGILEKESSRMMISDETAPRIAAWLQKKEGCHLPEGQFKSWLTLRLSGFWQEQGAWASSKELATKAQKNVCSWVEEFHLLKHRGDSSRKLAQYDEAEEAYGEALEISRAENAKLYEALVQLSSGNMKRELGQLEESLGHLSSAMALTEQHAAESPAHASSLNDYGLQKYHGGDLSAAEFYLRKGELLLRRLANMSSSHANSLNNLGALAWQNGQHDVAEEFLIRALEAQRKINPEGLDLATTLSNIGILAFRRGDWLRAEGLFLKALSIEKKLAPGSINVVQTLVNLGASAADRRDFDRARFHLTNAFDMLQDEARQSSTAAHILGSLGGAYGELGDLDKAYDLHLRALSLRENLGASGHDLALSHNALGLIKFKAREFQAAIKHNKTAVKYSLEHSSRSLQLGALLINASDIYLHSGQISEARQAVERAIDILGRLTPRSHYFATAMVKLGQICRKEGDFEGAEQAFLKSAEIYESRIDQLEGASNSMPTAFSVGEDLYKILAKFYFESERFELAFDASEKYRARNLLQGWSERPSLKKIPGHSEGTRELRKRRNAVLAHLATLSVREDKQAIDITVRKLSAIEENLKDLETQLGLELGLTDKNADSESQSTPIFSKETLDEGTLLLSYLFLGDELYLFAVQKGYPTEMLRLSTDTKDIRNLIDRFKHSLVPGDLYRRLLLPVEDRIGHSKRLLIIPDGPLHKIPFAAIERPIENQNSTHYLVEWKPIHFALSATVSQRLRLGRQRDDVNQRLFLVAFGDPKFPGFLEPELGDALSSGKCQPENSCPANRSAENFRDPCPQQNFRCEEEGIPKQPALSDHWPLEPQVRSIIDRRLLSWEELPHSRHEVESISAFFPEAHGVQLFLGPEASEESFKRFAPWARILHLATHGYTNENIPSHSFLALTIPSRGASEANEENGILDIHEISDGLDLDADLVVLSACRSGLGKSIGGDGLIGLIRAFQQAGARSVVASLWNVQDEATAGLMTQFYQHLKEGHTKDQALRLAQLDLIRSARSAQGSGAPSESDRAVRHWAAFQLYGDWQWDSDPLPFQERIN